MYCVRPCKVSLFGFLIFNIALQINNAFVIPFNNDTTAVDGGTTSTTPASITTHQLQMVPVPSANATEPNGVIENVKGNTNITEQAEVSVLDPVRMKNEMTGSTTDRPTTDQSAPLLDGSNIKAEVRFEMIPSTEEPKTTPSPTTTSTTTTTTTQAPSTTTTSTTVETTTTTTTTPAPTSTVAVQNETTSETSEVVPPQEQPQQESVSDTQANDKQEFRKGSSNVRPHSKPMKHQRVMHKMRPAAAGNIENQPEDDSDQETTGKTNLKPGVKNSSDQKVEDALEKCSMLKSKLFLNQKKFGGSKSNIAGSEFVNLNETPEKPKQKVPNFRNITDDDELMTSGFKGKFDSNSDTKQRYKRQAEVELKKGSKHNTWGLEVKVPIPPPISRALEMHKKLKAFEQHMKMSTHKEKEKEKEAKEQQAWPVVEPAGSFFPVGQGV